MEAEPEQGQTLKLSTNFEKSVYDLYQEVVSMTSPASRVELYIDMSELAATQRNKKKDHPLVFVSDILLALFQNVPNLKELSVEGYEMYCKTKKYMVHQPSEYGLFYKFAEYVNEYVLTGETQTYFKSIEKMEFRKSAMPENDLKVLGSSIFPNLKSIYCFYCTPTINETRHKYEEFLPNITWDDKYYEDDTTDKNELAYYNPADH